MMNPREIISGVVGLLIAAFVLAASLRLGVGSLHNPGSGFVLFWAGVLLAVCACILAGVNLAGKRGPVRPSDAGNRMERRNAAVVMAALIVYCWALPKLGYSISTFLLMAVLFGLGKMKPWMIVLSASSAALLSYYLFAHLLRTPLPRGLWGY
jgi:putative tricarboxylic transport membrane protein